LINRLNKETQVVLPSGTSGMAQSVDVSTGENLPASSHLAGNKITLKPFSVTVVEIK
jgi:hypothetical protein